MVCVEDEKKKDLSPEARVFLEKMNNLPIHLYTPVVIRSAPGGRHNIATHDGPGVPTPASQAFIDAINNSHSSSPKN